MMANTNIAATGAMSLMPRTMKVPVSSPKPPTSAAATGTAIIATSGDMALLMIAPSRTTMVRSPSEASIHWFLETDGEEAGEVLGNLDFHAQQEKRERLAVRVEAERLIHSAAQGPF